MTNETANITDTELLQKLQESYIDAEQKKELEPLIPEMNAEERNALVALIDKAQEEKDKAEPIYQAKVGKLNEEYTEKLDNLIKEGAKNTFKAVEEAEGKEEAEEMKDIETEIAAVEPAPKDKPTQAKSAEVKKEKPGSIGEKKHGLRNLILIFLVLALIASGAILAISYL